jgi:hypothetical protein
VILVAATAATLIVQNYRERAVRLEQEQAERQQIMQRFARLEQMYADAASSGERSRPAQPGATAVSSNVQIPETRDPKVTAENAAARAEAIQHANALVDSAIQSGQWSRADVIAFNTATYRLSGEEQAEIMARLAVAINADQVQVDFNRR